MLKKAYSVQMSYEVPDEEKHQAEKAISYFNHAAKLLSVASDYLNLMKTPFKETPDISPEEIMKTRAALRVFRDRSVEQFNLFKYTSFKCVKSMQNFASDTQTLKLMKSFITGIDDLQIKVNKFIELFNNLQDKDFVKNVIDSIESIQEHADGIDSAIDERIKPHIQNNILASNWVDDVGDELQIKLNKKTPIIIDLFNERQDQLNKVLKEKGPNI